MRKIIILVLALALFASFVSTAQAEIWYGVNFTSDNMSESHIASFEQITTTKERNPAMIRAEIVWHSNNASSTRKEIVIGNALVRENTIMILMRQLLEDNPEEINNNLTNFSTEVKNSLSSSTKNYNITIENVSVGNIVTDPDFTCYWQNREVDALKADHEEEIKKLIAKQRKEKTEILILAVFAVLGALVLGHRIAKKE